MIETGDTYPKISKKEELTQLLEKYKLVINTYMIDYLKCLIDLEVPVTKNYITDDERRVLSELDVYRKASIYNIYNLSKNLLKKYEDNYDIETIDEYGLLRFRLNGVNVFGFDYRNSNKNKEIGIISLFQNIEDAELRNEELERVKNKLDELYNQENPLFNKFNICEGPFDYWDKMKNAEIKAYQELFKKLESRKILTDKEMKSIELTKLFHDSFFKTFGLESNSFFQKKEDPFKIDAKSLEKVLVKKMPLLEINDNIKYI